jgi:hypothetical protein
MKRTFIVWMSLYSACITPAFAQGTAFTYQGRLDDGGSPAHGTYDFRFRLASDPLANNYIGSPYLTNSIAVTGGLFTATPDFGPGIFTGSNYWLEVDVRTNGGAVYTALNPLQPLTPAPYAVFANSSSNLLGLLPAGQLNGPIPNGNLPASASFSGTVTANTFAGNGVNVSNVNALTLNGLSSSNFWQLGGNNVSAGQILGSTNNQPVEIWVNGARALRLEPGTSGAAAPNIIGGSPVNFASNSVIGAVIGGGGTTNFFGFASTNSVTGNFGTVGGGWGNTAAGYSVVGGGYQNAATGSQATVAGGNGNIANQDSTTVSGGYVNFATNSYATVAGGQNNVAGGVYSVVAGGGGLTGNQATGPYSAVVGGEANYATNAYATVPGGFLNIAGGQYTFAAGQQAQATNDGAFVWADTQPMVFGSTRTNQFNVRANGGVRLVTSGAGITVDGFPLLTSGGGSGITIQYNTNGAPNIIDGSPYNFVTSGIIGATIAGGGATNFNGVSYTNGVLGHFGTVGGGAQNFAANYTVVAGGLQNIDIGNYSVIGGGWINTNDSDYAVISGGGANIIHDSGVSFIGGGNENEIVFPTVNNVFNVIGGGLQNVESNVVLSFIGGGVANTDYTSYSVIAGGATNILNQLSRYSFIGAGQDNTVLSNSDHSVIVGGLYNFIGTNSPLATIAGGVSNTISANTFNGTIGGGTNNVVSGASGTVAGGNGNTSAMWAAIGGGLANTAGSVSTVAGGENNQATGSSSAVGGGSINAASGNNSTVAGGVQNRATGVGSFIGGGGYDNGMSQGGGNIAGGIASTIAGGDFNQSSGNYSSVPGGYNNVASGTYSFAAGLNAQAAHQGAFVWADSQSGTFASTTNDEFSIRAYNGVRIQADKGIHLGANDRPIIVRDWDVFATNAPSYKAGIGRWGLFMEPFNLTIGIPDNIANRFFQIAKYSTNGTYTTLVLVDQAGDLYATNNVFAKGVQLTSDRNAKEHFTALNPQSVLAKVAAMPITEWNYKSENVDDKHIGPMAQDFHEAFGLNGNDDKHISAVDGTGVALSAIQGLNQEVEDLKTENAELKQRLATLEKLIESRK